eukprot:4582197-Pyramimonas_sp.AAC.1
MGAGRRSSGRRQTDGHCTGSRQRGRHYESKTSCEKRAIIAGQDSAEARYPGGRQHFNKVFPPQRQQRRMLALRAAWRNIDKFWCTPEVSM